MDPDIIEFAQVMVVIVASIAGLAVVLLGTRVLWRLGSGTKSVASFDTRESDDRMRRLETAVDSIAIEVERISEAQRFMVGLLGDPSRANAPLASRSASGRTNTPH